MVKFVKNPQKPAIGALYEKIAEARHDDEAQEEAGHGNGENAENGRAGGPEMPLPMNPPSPVTPMMMDAVAGEIPAMFNKVGVQRTANGQCAETEEERHPQEQCDECAPVLETDAKNGAPPRWALVAGKARIRPDRIGKTCARRSAGHARSFPPAPSEKRTDSGASASSSSATIMGRRPPTQKT